MNCFVSTIQSTFQFKTLQQPTEHFAAIVTTNIINQLYADEIPTNSSSPDKCCAHVQFQISQQIRQNQRVHHSLAGNFARRLIIPLPRLINHEFPVLRAALISRCVFAGCLSADERASARRIHYGGSNAQSCKRRGLHSGCVSVHSARPA